MLTFSKDMMQVICLTAAAIAATGAVSWGETSHRVRVTIVGQQSSLHTSVSNRDVYLLRVTPRKGSAFDAIAVDNYPAYAEALPTPLLNTGAAFSVKLLRTPYCDRVAGGDGQGASVRCFAIDHGSWKMPKSIVPDPWWK